MDDLIFSEEIASDDWDVVTTDPAPKREDIERICRECGKGLPPYTKRGRKPTLCDECKAKKPTVRRTSTGREQPGIAKIRQSYAAHAYGLGGLLRIVEPFDGAVIQNNSQTIGEMFATAAATSPKVKKALESTSEATGWLQIAVGLSTILYPIMVHHNVIRVPEAMKRVMEAQVLGTVVQPVQDDDTSSPGGEDV